MSSRRFLIIFSIWGLVYIFICGTGETSGNPAQSPKWFVFCLFGLLLSIALGLKSKE